MKADDLMKSLSTKIQRAIDPALPPGTTFVAKPGFDTIGGQHKVLHLYNTRTRRKEEFRALDESGNNVRMYACGLTVYNSPHLGNARAFVVPDVLRRWLEHRGFNVRFVTNFTDIDDKIIRRAAEEKRDWREITAKYTEEYHHLALALNVKPADAYPRATDNIADMIELIKRLFDRSHAYISADGDVYFHSPSFPAYGTLSGRTAEEEEEGAGFSGRLADERRAVKKHSSDFVLWKSAKPGEPAWPSPWGAGRPGWHIECSAMARRWLGLPFDIHCGGADLIFPHHEDEKAQSECAYADELQGREAVRFWVHNGFLTIGQGDEKMSKSLGNMKYVRELIRPTGPYEPAALRMFLISAHYRSPLRFEPPLLDEAAARLERLRNFFALTDRCDSVKLSSSWPTNIQDSNQKSKVAAASEEFEQAMDDDLNTARALAAVFSLAGEINRTLAGREANSLSAAERAEAAAAAAWAHTALETLGVRMTSMAGRHGVGVADGSGFEDGSGYGGGSACGGGYADGSGYGGGGDANPLLTLLLETRLAARKAKQFALSDQIRDGLGALSYEIQDLPGGKSEAKKK